MKTGSSPTRARKRFGQHFLEAAWVSKVIQAIDPQADDDFIEIGPGRGALTRPLAERARHVTAFEIDRDLAAALRAAAIERVTVVEGDFLAIDVKSQIPNPKSQRNPIRVAGNLPYNVASPIMFKLVELFGRGVALTDATLMLQLEVAERLAAGPGGREYGVLSVLMQQAADVDRLLTLPPGAFRPVPKVRSAVVRLRFREPVCPADRPAAFARLVQAIFTRRRKTIGNALLAVPAMSPAAAAAALERSGIDPRRRPETLTIPELVRLSNAVL